MSNEKKLSRERLLEVYRAAMAWGRAERRLRNLNYRKGEFAVNMAGGLSGMLKERYDHVRPADDEEVKAAVVAECDWTELRLLEVLEGRAVAPIRSSAEIPDEA